MTGKYGLTQFSYAIADKPENLKKIKEAMDSARFIKLMNYTVFGQNHKYNYKVIALFKKDFWKYFLKNKKTNNHDLLTSQPPMKTNFQSDDEEDEIALQVSRLDNKQKLLLSLDSDSEDDDEVLFSTHYGGNRQNKTYKKNQSYIT